MKKSHFILVVLWFGFSSLVNAQSQINAKLPCFV